MGTGRRATAVSSFSQGAAGLLFQNGEVLRLAPEDIAKQPDYEGDFEFAGVDDNYFMTVALSVTGAKVSFQPVSIPPPAGSKATQRASSSPIPIEPRTVDQPIRFFVGPKDFGVLSAVNRELPNAINFGMFKVIVVPLLQSLKWVNSFVGNYGWSIVILTIVINAIMFPLRHKSTVSMRKMQELQPQVKAIQDRYAKLKSTDPAKQKMNQELMALYRERGVNPASGCVPILLTMPVLLAMWALLQTSIELRGAPWFGWIRDLSVHDPYYVLAVLMGVTGFWQQKMMPHDRRRSCAAENDDVHAADDDGDARLAAGGRAHLLCGHEHLDDRPAISDQLPDWAADHQDDTSASRAPAEARGRRQDRRGGARRGMTP